MFSNIKDDKTKKLGLDKLNLLIILMVYIGNIQEEDGDEISDEELSKATEEFYQNIEGFIDRELLDTGKANLMRGMAMFFGTEVETPERGEAIEYLADLMFLKD